jgi:hypothetical protein
MSYAVYNGKMVQAGGKFILSPPVINVLDFDGSTYVQFSSVPAFPGSTVFDVTFGMYLDNDSGYSYGHLFFICNTNGPAPTKNILSAVLYQDQLLIWGGTSGFGSSVKVGITGFANKNVNVAISVDTSQVGNYSIINDVKFNGQSQSLNTDAFGWTVENTFRIGIGRNLETYSILKNATIWDLNINNNYIWKGYPGNQNTGWEDQVSNIDGTLSGIPALANPQTRKIIHT